MGLLSRFEGKMEDTVEGAAERMGGSSLSPVQIAKKAEKQMRREKMVGAGKQYAPTLYTVLVSVEDDRRLFGYYPTLAGETETYLSAKANEHGLAMDGQPLVRFIADDGLKRGKFEVIAELVAAPLVRQLRQEEMERYGLAAPQSRAPQRGGGRAASHAASPAMGAHGLGAHAARGAHGLGAPAAAAPVGAGSAAAAAAGGYELSIGVGAPASANAAAAQRGGALQGAFLQPGALDAGLGAAPAAGGGAQLVDTATGQSYQLTGAPQRLGREAVCDLVVPDINASRSHAEVRRDPSGAWLVSDLGSTNGTFLNGRQIKSAPLRPGDIVTIGTTDLEFRPQ